MWNRNSGINIAEVIIKSCVLPLSEVWYGGVEKQYLNTIAHTYLKMLKMSPTT